MSDTSQERDPCQTLSKKKRKRNEKTSEIRSALEGVLREKFLPNERRTGLTHQQILQICCKENELLKKNHPTASSLLSFLIGKIFQVKKKYSTFYRLVELNGSEPVLTSYEMIIHAFGERVRPLSFSSWEDYDASRSQKEEEGKPKLEEDYRKCLTLSKIARRVVNTFPELKDIPKDRMVTFLHRRMKAHGIQKVRKKCWPVYWVDDPSPSRPLDDACRDGSQDFGGSLKERSDSSVDPLEMKGKRVESPPLSVEASTHLGRHLLPRPLSDQTLGLTPERRKDLLLCLLPWFGGRYIGELHDLADSQNTTTTTTTFHQGSLIPELGGFLSFDNKSRVFSVNKSAIAQTCVVDSKFRYLLRDLYLRAFQKTTFNPENLVIEASCWIDHQDRHKDERRVKSIFVVDLGKIGCLEYLPYPPTIHGGGGKQKVVTTTTTTTTTVKGSYIWENVGQSQLEHRGMVGSRLSACCPPMHQKKMISGRIILIFREYSKPFFLTQSVSTPVIQNRLLANSLLSEAVQEELQRNKISQESLQQRTPDEIVEILCNFVKGCASLKPDLPLRMASSKQSVHGFLDRSDLQANSHDLAALGAPLPSRGFSISGTDILDGRLGHQIAILGHSYTVIFFQKL